MALVAAQATPSGPTSGRPAVRLMVNIPPPLEVAMFGLFTLTALLVLWLLVPRALRRRKKDPDTIEMVYENPKVSPWFTVALLVVSAAPLATLGYLLWTGWSPFEEGELHVPIGPGLSVPPVAPAPRPFVPMATEPWFSGAVTLLALAVGVGCLALVLWLLFGDRMVGSWEGLKPRASEGLLDAIEDSLDALRQEADARQAIIRCYRRFEQALGRRGLPRDPWETPTEFMRRALGRLPLPPPVARDLIDLFHLARFSDHPMGLRERDLAVDALVELRATLEGEGANAAAV